MMIVKNKTYIKPELELKALKLEGMMAVTPQGEGFNEGGDSEGGGDGIGNVPAKGGFNFDWSEL